jgi:hypothetical protein
MPHLHSSFLNKYCTAANMYAILDSNSTSLPFQMLSTMTSLATTSVLNLNRRFRNSVMVSVTMLMFLPLLLNGQEASLLVRAALSDCQPPVIKSVSTVGESTCGARDGQIVIELEDGSSGDHAYTVTLMQDKGTTSYDGISGGNPLVINGLKGSGYHSIQLTREADDCTSAVFEEHFIVQHGCENDGSRNTGCGSGTINYVNCDGQTIQIEEANISPDTYIFLDDYYIGCIGYVNSSCQIEPSEEVYCADYSLTAPTPGSGYEYGEALFTKEFGLVANLGISELAAERINWVLCNGISQGYSEAQVNQAIWYFTGTNSNCNSLCSAAINAITSVQGGIDQNMVVYIPANSSLQPFIENNCYCSGAITGLFFNDLGGSSDVTITSGGSYSIDNLPSSFSLEASTQGQVGSVIFSITGDYTGTNTENAFPYNAPGGNSPWNVSDGTFTVEITLYSGSNGSGEACDTETFTFTITDCIDDGGHIDDDEVSCGAYDPAQITGDYLGAVQYQWQFRLGTSGSWANISGATSQNYNPGTITQTTQYRRRARSNSQCPWQYSNVLTKEVLANCQPVPGDWVFDCGENKQVDEYGYNAKCNDMNTITIPNSGNVYQYVVEIVYKGSNPGSFTTITDASGNDYNLLRITPSGGSSNVWVYRGEISGTTSSITYNVPSGTDSCKLQSIVVYAFRNTITNANSGIFTSKSGYNDIQTVVVPIPSGNGPRDVTLQLPISELTPDGRYLKIEALAGGQSAETFIYGPDATLPGGNCCLAIPEVTITDVPAATTSVTINIDTRNGQNGQGVNGQSWVIAGLINVETDCFICTLTADAGPNQTVCVDANVTLTASASGGTTPYTFEWSNSLGSGATQTFVATVTNTYTVSVTDANGCMVEDQVMVTVNPLPNPGQNTRIDDGAFVSGHSVEVCEGQDVTLDFSGGAYADWTFVYTGPNNLNQTNTGYPDADQLILNDITLEEDGSYNVTFTDPNGCSNSAVFYVTVNERPDVTVSIVDASCGNNNGEITFTFPDNPNRTYIEFSFDGGNAYQPQIADNSGSITYDGFAPGTYTLFARWGDDDCPTSLGNVTIVDQPGPTADAGDDQTICVGESITLSASSSGGTSPVTLSWSTGDTGSTTTVSPIVTTTYTVTATDDNGCVATDQVTVNVNPLPTYNVVNVFCSGFFNIYNVELNTDANQVTSSLGTVSDNGGGSFLITGIPNLQNVDITLTNTTTGCSVTQTVDFPNCFCPNVLPPDSDGDQVICQGATIPALSVMVSESETTVDWYDAPSGGNLLLAGSLTYTPMAAGTYYAEARRTNLTNCVSDARTPVTLTINPLPNADAGNDQIICFGETATLSATGGNDYEWDTGDMTATIMVTPNTTTTYNVTVTDANGCINTDDVTVTVNALPQLTNIATVDPSCGNNNGEIIFTFVDDPDRPAIEFSLDDGNTYPLNVNDNSGTASFDGLAPGTYDLWVRWGNNDCPVDLGPVTLTDQPGPGITASNDVVICVGDNTTLTANTSGGTAPVTITWMPGNLTGASVSVNPTTTTTYTVTVTDDNGCTDTDQVTVEVDNTEIDPDGPTVIEICVGETVSFPVTTNATKPPYNFIEYVRFNTQQANPYNPTEAYTWLDEFALPATSGTISSSNFPLINDAPTTYYVYACVKPDPQAGFCQPFAEFIVTVYPDVTVDAGISQTICEGGMVTLTATINGGGAPFNFVWTDINTGNQIGTGASINVTPTETSFYSVAVTSAGGCTANDNVTVNVEDDPTVSISIDNSEVCEGETSTLTATTIGGVDCSGAQWEFRVGTSGTWTGLAMGTTLDTDAGLTPGTYQYRASVSCNGNGCDAATSNVITFTVKPFPTATVDDASICSGETVTFTAPSNTAGTTYTWDFGNNASPATATGSGPHVVTYTLPSAQIGNGSATVSLTATLNGCVATDDATITIFDTPEGTLSGTDATCGQNNGSLTITFPNNPDRTNIEFSINGVDFETTPDNTGSYTFDNLAAGTYSITARWDDGDCTTNLGDININQLNGPSIIASDDVSVCFGGTANLTAITSGGTDPVTITWNPGNLSGASIDVMPSMTTTYTLTATDANGCTNTDQVTVTVNPRPMADAGHDVSICANQAITLTAAAIAGTPGYSYLWSTGETTTSITVSPDMTTTYVVTVTDASGCVATDDVIVTVNNNLCARIGDFVWEDLDADGIQDAGEPGIQGVTVNLLDDNGNTLETTTTDPTGFYEFTDLVPGDYIVEFATPAGFSATPADQGGDDTVDSDANLADGRTATITINQGDDNPTIDAGFYRSAAIGNFVWEDIDGDGVQDAGEPGIENVTVTLQDDNGNTLATTTTDATGFYEFTNLTPGDYVVVFGTPAGFEPTPANQGGDDDLDSDAVGGQTGTINIESGEVDNSNDAGFYQPASLGSPT